jgi:hypothetical protein
MKKMQSIVGDPKPPFSREEGSADRPQGVSGWVYAAGLAVIGGLTGAWYRQNRSVRP